MRLSKRLPILIVLSFVLISSLAQDIIVTAHGELDESPVSMDSLLFENLSNKTSLVFNDMPDQNVYVMNLTSQELVSQTGIPSKSNPSELRIKTCIPGEMELVYNVRSLTNASIEALNINGQMIHYSPLGDLAGNGSIRIILEVPGFYVVRFQSSEIMRTFKAVGSSYNGGIRVFNSTIAPNMSVKQKSAVIPREVDFSIQVGDSLKATAFKTNYYAPPVLLKAKENNSIAFSFTDSIPGDTTRLTDSDGNTYETVRIGEQVWMAENLRTTTFNDGMSIPFASFGNSSKNPGYGWYNNDSVAYSLDYGALYNWYAIETGKLCPSGWHVADDYDWNVLINFLGGGSVAGDKLKEAGTDHWNSPNSATNESGFNALPGGLANYGYVGMGGYGYWWSATALNDSSAWYWHMWYNHGGIAHYYDSDNKSSGMSVRCIKDSDMPGHVPMLLTIDPSAISDTSAIVGGNVYDDGGSTVTETGVYWGVSPDPDISGAKLSIGSGTGKFSSLLTGLSHSTTYYIKAYAVNEFGEALGNEISLTTADSTGMTSFLKVNENEYELIDGIILYDGTDSLSGIYYREIFLLSPGHNINWETLEITGSGAVVYFELYNKQADIASGEYSFSTPELMETVLVLDTVVCDSVDNNGDGIINEDDCMHWTVYTMPDGAKYISSDGSAYDEDTNLNDFTGLYFDSGNVNITCEDDTSTFNFDCLGENGDVIQGYYKGTLHYYDYSENK